jgi:hypothetical protein
MGRGTVCCYLDYNSLRDCCWLVKTMLQLYMTLQQVRISKTIATGMPELSISVSSLLYGLLALELCDCSHVHTAPRYH